MSAQPVTAPASAGGDSYTILRVKRKRNEEPLDALVFDAHTRKRTKDSKPASVFQFAETVEGSAWQDDAARRKLQDRIAALVQAPTDAAQPDVAAESSAAATLPLPRLKRAAESSDASAVRKYTIIENKDDGGRPQPKSFQAPPAVVPSRAKAPKGNFNLYDAVPESRPQAPSPVDPEIERFLPLLQEYLKVSEIDLEPSAPTATPGRPRRESDADEDADAETRIGAADEDDYVWDVYYYRPTLTTWNALAHGGNVGSLNGLPPSINDPNQSDSESEPEDEDDEDSNAEDYYKNDYPDEESDFGSSADEGQAESDDDDFLKDQLSDEEEHDWR